MKYRLQFAILFILAALLYYALMYRMLFEFLMFIVMWIQLELAYRQWWLDWRSRKPYFKANILSETSATFLETAQLSTTLHLHIKNVGNVPAYMVGIGRILDAESRKPLNPSEWGKYVKVFHVDLASGEEKVLADIPEEFLKAYKDRDGVILEVYYNNPLEPIPLTLRSMIPIHLKYSSDGWHAIIFEIYEEPSGILTKIPNMIRDISAYLKLKQYLKPKEAYLSRD
jgi:hypothetical protein